jgi:non-specific serine/threonine protein kinase/serine/threonine-protein kinase
VTPVAIDPARAKSLFLAASDLADPTERAAYLDRECGADTGLRARVEALLRADDAAPISEPGAAGPAGVDPSEVPATATCGAASAEPTADYPGRDQHAGAVIAGKYTLVEPIGAGGMGVVWRAKQTEPVKRFVAVKLIKAGMDSRQVLARFEAERQALALMDHPNIAKVLDGGLHDGRPFFVMELVKGLPITEYCDHHKLTPKERLELFVPVCQAIQHAHQKGVIHRDIKPSNVIVAMYDDRPVVKVIDFGVAKATGAALTERTLDTGFGGVVGTPQYMSPEQATFDNLDIDTRSDVYALGVLLYELLTGSPPFAPRELEKRGLLEILRVVREDEPPRPSTRLNTADALPTLSANRGTEPKKLTGLLRNELDWIVMKALEKDRTRRYETANGFAADVLRYLSGEAVQAHPPSASYRLKKFARRHKGQAIALTVVLGTLVVGTVGITLGLLEARRQRDAADAERQNALAERAATVVEKQRADEAARSARLAAQRADTINDFLIKGLLAQADPRNNPVGDKLTVRQLLDRASTAVDNDPTLLTQPDVEASIRGVLGNVYLQLGAYQQAEPLLRRALDLHRPMRGDDDAVTLDAANDLGIILRQLDRFPEAAELLRDVQTRRTRLLGSDSPKTISAENNLAVVLMNQGQWTQAEAMFRSCRERIRKIPGFDEREYLFVVANLAWVLESQEDVPAKVAEAAKLLRDHMSDFRRVWGEKSPEIYTVWDSLGTAVRLLGDPAAAVEWHRKALAGRRFMLGEDQDLTLASRNNLALALLGTGKPKEAEAIFRDLLATKSPTGIIELRRPYYLHNLALSLREQGRIAEAEPYMRESHEAWLRTGGPTHRETLDVVRGLMDLQVLRGGWSDAEILLSELVPAVRAKFDPALPLVADFRHRLGWVRLQLGKYEDAEPDLRAGLAYREKAMPNLWPTFNTTSMLGGALLGQKKYAEAEPLLRKGYEGMKQREKSIPPQAAPRLPEALDRLIELSVATNRPDDVKKWRAERAKYPSPREVGPPPREKT